MLSAHDDLLCNKQWLDGNIMTPMRLYVDAGTCAPAKIPDERSGPFAELFFVAARDMDSWDPNGVYVDTISHGSVFISRQGCEGECPETADLFECPAAEPWPDDRVEMRFVGYAYEPSSDGYDHVCEILSVEDNAEQVTYVLDCGAL
ncbi:hypothetical protein PPSIR1_14420 [Plesiocystis pacifica SIR-1]|uniref:Uncharacterized protein n=1 Tax=Plesiocystis pacifica SIR-1 TaxID=391625 RepID=A6GJG2_9BACT|nr:hypothetical protein [Plesiocystis pacifica]EDM73977.1 hypothetical protein PPSIR1_14420 [Plesiocystis pacifica SIR-1]